MHLQRFALRRLLPFSHALWQTSDRCLHPSTDAVPVVWLTTVDLLYGGVIYVSWSESARTMFRVHRLEASVYSTFCLRRRALHLRDSVWRTPYIIRCDKRFKVKLANHGLHHVATDLVAAERDTNQHVVSPAIIVSVQSFAI